MSERKNTRYLAMWDCHGLECLFNITDWDHKRVWATLKEEEQPRCPNLQTLLMRARVNSHRHYEIYLFDADNCITEDDIRDQFTDHPQFIVDFIRKNGIKLYSDKITLKNRVII